MLASMPALIMTTKWKRDGNSGLRVSKLLKGENEHNTAWILIRRAKTAWTIQSSRR